MVIWQRLRARVLLNGPKRAVSGSQSALESLAHQDSICMRISWTWCLWSSRRLPTRYWCNSRHVNQSNEQSNQVSAIKCHSVVLKSAMNWQQSIEYSLFVERHGDGIRDRFQDHVQLVDFARSICSLCSIKANIHRHVYWKCQTRRNSHWSHPMNVYHH
jgi:hypothetical protein